MSVQAMAAVLALPDTVQGTQRLVLLALANHANDRMECWPSVDTLAAEAGVHRDTARRALRALSAAGWVTRHPNAAPDSRIRGDRRPSLYRLRLAVDDNGQAVGSPVADPVDDTATGVTTPHPRDSHGGDDLSSTGVAICRHGGDDLPPQTISEPSGNPSADPAGQPPRQRSAAQQRRDDLFDALLQVDGVAEVSDLTKTQRSHVGKLVSELVGVDATGTDVAERARAYRRRHPTWDLTAAALVKHWATLAPRSKPRDADTGSAVGDDGWAMVYDDGEPF